MKKKGKAIRKKKSASSRKDGGKKTTSRSVRKIMVGEDEFCPTCMEWRAFDEATGKCLVCGCLIKKVGGVRKISDEYDLKDFTNDHDEPPDTDEF